MNRLAQETSPYLLQHADNPVDWYPWGEEALALARELDKPILLSVGYAACHWCHVMAHESFEDPATAAYMNEHFVNVKVDREERPDIDNIYMTAVQAMTGQGGWPMTVVMTPAGEPFYGGTYFPPVPRHGMPSFRQVLEAVINAWQTKRDDILTNAAQMKEHISRTFGMEGGEAELNQELLDQAVAGLARRFDSQRGGFGGAPKFPQPMILEFLLRYHHLTGSPDALHMAETTLRRMADGGMYDHLGGGFARYSTDNEWLVPHFEKMLYDNAQLARVYLHAYQATGDAYYRRVVEETLDYVVQEMRHEEGGFYSSQDADSEGVEGKFYVWQPAEIRAVLGDEAELFMAYYDVTAGGNWEGQNILNVKRPIHAVALEQQIPVAELQARLAAARAKLYAVRAERIWPGLDDKILTAWNGLMLAAFAEAGRVLNRPDYTTVAAENALFLQRVMRRDNGRLLRTWKAGHEPKLNGYLEDYAYLADGLLALYQTTFDERWYSWAIELIEIARTHFRDEAAGGFFDTSDDHEALIFRPKDVQDNAVPSGNAMMAHNLLLANLYTGEGGYVDAAADALRALHEALAQYAQGFAQWLCAATLYLGQPVEIAINGDPGLPETEALVKAAQSGYRPLQVLAVGGERSPIPLLADRPRLEGQATAYVCRGFVCNRPVTTPEALREQLGR
ncbi:MAG: thioredoxin domain-containing protein [Ardenticatenales bacterium]|nr:thioredoxin domain-containing protein [Ardenticatenales bacterium]